MYQYLGKTFILISFLLTLLLPFGSIMAQEAQAEKKKNKLIFGSEMRLRYEFQNNFNQKFYGDGPGQGSSNDGFLLGRFRAGLDWYPTDKIHIAVWGQDSEAWDMDMPNSSFYKKNFLCDHNPNKDRWELYTTYIELKDLFDKSLNLKAGRQLIFYGNNRVFGPGQWGNTGRWIWDAIKISWRFDRGFIDMFYGQTMLHEVNRFSIKHRHGFASIGAYTHVDLMRKPFFVAIEPMIFSKYDKHHNYTGEKTGEGDLDSWYAGARLYGSNISGFDFDCTFLQEQGDFSNDDLRAYGYHLMVGYKLKTAWRPKLSLEYTYASGDSNPNDNDHETFQGAFGARDKMYGRMNLFHWRNLRDIEAGLSIKPLKGLNVKVSFHKFLLAERKDGWYLNSKTYRDKTGRSGNEVGRELDIVAKYKLSKSNVFMAGFGHFWPDEFAKKTASNKQANWIFLQWEYKFKHTFF